MRSPPSPPPLVPAGYVEYYYTPWMEINGPIISHITGHITRKNLIVQLSWCITHTSTWRNEWPHLKCRVSQGFCTCSGPGNHSLVPCSRLSVHKRSLLVRYSITLSTRCEDQSTPTEAPHPTVTTVTHFRLQNFITNRHSPLQVYLKSIVKL